MLELVGRPDAALTLVFIKAREMRALNLRHRARDYATDVLSFAYPVEKIDGVPFLGEVVVAPEVAAGNARARGIAVEAELRRIIVHGILHLAGYDHETDSGEMNRLQTRLLGLRRLARHRLLRPSEPPAAAAAKGLK